MSKKSKLLLGLAILLGIALFAKIFLLPYGVTGSVAAESVYELAIQKEDISICDKVHLIMPADVTNNELRGSCYIEYVRQYPDPKICSRMGNSFSCLNAIAVASKDPTACLDISDGGYRALCVSNAAVKRHDVTTCKVLADINLQEKCKRHFDSNPNEDLL